MDKYNRRFAPILSLKRRQISVNRRPGNVAFLVDRASMWRVPLPVLRSFPCQYHSTNAPNCFNRLSRLRDAISTINSVANNTFKRTTSYSRRSESSSALLWGPYTSHRMRFLQEKCLFQGEFNYDSHSSFITSPTPSLIHSQFVCALSVALIKRYRNTNCRKTKERLYIHVFSLL